MINFIFQDFLINIKFNEQHVNAFIKYKSLSSLTFMHDEYNLFLSFLNLIQMFEWYHLHKILSSKTFF